MTNTKTIPDALLIAARDAAELITTKEAAAIANVGERSWWRWSRSGQAPAPVKIGAAVRFRRREIWAWIAAGCPAVKDWQWEGNRDA